MKNQLENKIIFILKVLILIELLSVVVLIVIKNEGGIL